jgi:hypothetical protein
MGSALRWSGWTNGGQRAADGWMGEVRESASAWLVAVLMAVSSSRIESQDSALQLRAHRCASLPPRRPQWARFVCELETAEKKQKKKKRKKEEKKKQKVNLSFPVRDSNPCHPREKRIY